MSSSDLLFQFIFDARLQLVDPLVSAGLGYQLCMGPDLDDAPLVQDQDLVSSHRALHPVGDDKSSTSVHQATQCFSNAPFCFGINGGGGIVQ